ncbi:OmpA family protein [bacterium]|nr:OmpA family protein [bacterium]
MPNKAKKSNIDMRKFHTQKGSSGGSPDEGQEWLTIYSDLMTLLFVFFVLLYIFSVTGQLPLLTEALQSFQNEEGQKYRIAEDQSSIPPGNAEVIFTLPSQVLFDLGKAELKPEALPFLQDAVKKMKTVFKDAPDSQIRVEGYTDNLPIHNWRYKSNWELSAARAISVVRYLIEEHSFPPEQLQAMGYGEYNPVAPNDTPDNRQRNRRVELKIVKPPSSVSERPLLPDNTLQNPSTTGESSDGVAP